MAKKNQQQRNLPRAADRNEPVRVLTAYRWDEAKKDYLPPRHFVTTGQRLEVEGPTSKADPREPVADVNGLPFEGVDRVVFHNLDELGKAKDGKLPPLLVLDAIPHKDSKVTWKDKGRGETEIEIILLLQSVFFRRNVKVQFKLRQQSGSPSKPQYTEFHVLELRKLDEVTKRFVRIDDTNLLPGKDGKPRSLAETLQHPDIQQPDVLKDGKANPNRDKLKVYLLENQIPERKKFFEAINLSLRNTICDQQNGNELAGGFPIQLYFEKRGAELSAFYALHFSSEMQSRKDCSDDGDKEFTLRGFSQGDEWGLKIETVQLQQDWLVVQAPTSELRAEEKPRPQRDQRPPNVSVVAVRGVPTRSMRQLWNKFVDRYYVALKTVLGGQPLSFLPHFTLEHDLKQPWAMAYRLTDATSVSEVDYRFIAQEGALADSARVTVQPLSLQPYVKSDLVGTLEQIKAMDNKPLEFTLAVARWPEQLGDSNPAAFEDPYHTGIIFWTPQPVLSAKNRYVRMGALDLLFSTEKDLEPDAPGHMRVWLQGDLAATQVTADLRVGRVRPGGQDDVPGEEYISECRKAESSAAQVNQRVQDREITEDFRRERPVVIRWEPQNAPPPATDKLLLHVEEEAIPASLQPGRTQSITLTLHNRAATRSQEVERVIVLDRNPLLIALVEFPRFYQQARAESTAIANWKNFGLEGANWEILSRAEPFDLILPPQAVGEEMEKSTKANGSVNNRLFDFRLAPTTKLRLLPSFFAQNFTEAPWNLRRVLGYVGQRAPGAGVKRLQFELLYGLSCDAEAPFLRLAEIAALTGAIPGQLPRGLQWQGSQAQREAYLQARRRWAELYQQCLNRVGILEPWDAHQPESLLLSEGLTCRIRFPDDPLGASEMEDPVEPANQGALKGGVTWGVESKNIYTALKRPDATKKENAQVGDLAFSSLGGWGKLKAAFDEDRSIIYADVAMGRTYFYKLERLGCIGCFRNKAKHVIVFERTVAPSGQFASEQNELLGRPVVRKVKEYIQILQEERSYPDVLSQNSVNTQQVLERQRGPVAYCAFEKGAKINVSSAWGSDVEDRGWKVPLWRPDADPNVYPKPRISLGVFSNVAGRSVPQPCVIEDPQKLYFYTETKQKERDSDKWALVKDLEYVDLPLPAPLTDFAGGNMEQTTPDDVPVPAGFAPVTFTLAAAPAPADVMAARGGQPMAAALRTVTVSRALLKEAEGLKASKALDLLNARTQLAQGYQQVFTELLRSKDSAVVKLWLVEKIKDKEGTLKERFEIFFKDSFVRAVEEARAAVLATDKLKDRITEREKKIVDSLCVRLAEATEKISKDYREWAETIKQKPNQTPDDFKKAKDALKLAVKNELDEIRTALALLPRSAGVLQKVVRDYYETATRLLKYTEDVAKDLLTGFDNWPDQLAGDQLARLRIQVQRALAEASALAAAVRRAGDLRTEQWVPVLASYVEEKLAEIAKFEEQKRRELEAGLLQVEPVSKHEVKRLIEQFKTWKDETRTSIDALKKQIELPDQIKDKPILLYLDKAIAAIEAKFAEQLNDLEKTIDQANTIEAAVQNSINQFETYVRKGKEDAKNIFKQLEGVEDQIITQAKTLADTLFAEEAKRLQAQFDTLVGNDGAKLKEKLLAISNTVEDARRELEGLRRDVLGHLDDFTARNISHLISQTEQKTMGAITDGGFRLVRAFGQPPEVPNLEFMRERVAYFFKDVEDKVDLTPVLSLVNQARQIEGAITDRLKPLSVKLPTKAVLEQLIPPELQDFNVSELFPDFAGLKLANLFAGLKLPSLNGKRGDKDDRVQISHGVDPQSRRAWFQAHVNVPMDKPTTVLPAGPVELRLLRARFQADSLIEATLNEPPRRKLSGNISGDWELIVAGMPLVLFKETALLFDDAGGLRFSILPKNVQLPDVMKFIEDFLSSFSSGDSGLTVGLMPTGVQALLNLPIPDIQVGVFGISNLRLGARLALEFAPEFAIQLGFNLGRKQAPFALTIFILGGGGFVEVTTSFLPATGSVVCVVEVGITACASLALALGPIKGGVYVYVGIIAQFISGSSSGLTIGLMFLLRGEVSLLGIAEASISLLLEAKYETGSGKLIGHGQLTIKIKICWCFTLEIDEEVTYTLGGNSSTSYLLPDRRLDGEGAEERLLAERRGGPNAELDITDSYEPVAATDSPNYERLAGIYIDMLS